MSEQQTAQVLRQHAETEFAHELAALREVDKEQRPTNWVLSCLLYTSPSPRDS